MILARLWQKLSLNTMTMSGIISSILRPIILTELLIYDYKQIGLREISSG